MTDHLSKSFTFHLSEATTLRVLARLKADGKIPADDTFTLAVLADYEERLNLATGAVPKARKVSPLETTVRAFLDAKLRSSRYSTRELSVALNIEVSDISTLAKHMPAEYATQTGEQFKSYGDIKRKWVWHGQRSST